MGKKKPGGQPAKTNNFSEINKLIAKFLQDATKDFSKSSDINKIKEPIIYRFNVRVGANGRPSIESFGNVRPTEQKVSMAEKKAPLVDTIERTNDITVIAEMPGTDKKNIKITAAHNELTIEAKSKGARYSRKVRLNGTINPNSGIAKFRNGILEVTFDRSTYTNRSAVLRVKD
jgi:HSP20 family protein